ncbi:MAG: hypothetical protein AAB393_04405, partial [Bacteroidota bacterium]
WKKEEEKKERLAQEGRELLKQESVNTYRNMLRDAWVDGKPGREEQSMLDIVRPSLGVDGNEHALMEREVQREVFTAALRSALKNGVITPEDAVTKDNLRTMYAVSSEDYLVIETRLLREMNREIQNH